MSTNHCAANVTERKCVCALRLMLCELRSQSSVKMTHLIASLPFVFLRSQAPNMERYQFSYTATVLSSIRGRFFPLSREYRTEQVTLRSCSSSTLLPPMCLHQSRHDCRTRWSEPDYTKHAVCPGLGELHVYNQIPTCIAVHMPAITRSQDAVSRCVHMDHCSNTEQMRRIQRRCGHLNARWGYIMEHCRRVRRRQAVMSTLFTMLAEYTKDYTSARAMSFCAPRSIRITSFMLLTVTLKSLALLAKPAQTNCL